MDIHLVRQREQLSRNCGIGLGVTFGVLSASVGIALAILVKKDIVSLNALAKSMPGIIVISGASVSGLCLVLSVGNGATFLYFRKKRVDFDTEEENWLKGQVVIIETQERHEQARAQAEQLRVQQEKQAEQEKAELDRMLAEQARKQAEQARKQAEQARKQAEQARIQAEQAKVRQEKLDADQARIVQARSDLKNQISLAKAYFDNPANEAIINAKVAEAKRANLPFAAFRPNVETDTPDIPGVLFRVEYFYNEGKIYLKYGKAFSRGVFRVASKVVDIRTGSHFAESLAFRNYFPNYYSSKGKKPNYVPETFIDPGKIEAIQSCIESLSKKVPELLPASFTVTYTKTSLGLAGRIAVKTLQYTVLKTGTLQREFFADKDEKFKIDAAKQVIKAVANYHLGGYCHNDIKGANFVYEIVNGKLEIKLIDYLDTIPIFGKSLNNAGTPIYFSPETARFAYDHTQEPNNEKRDSWALGMTILGDIFGIDAQWSAPAVQDVPTFKNLVTDRNILPDLSKIPDEIQSIVRRLLDKNPATRMTAYEADQHLSLVPIIPAPSSSS